MSQQMRVAKLEKRVIELEKEILELKEKISYLYTELHKLNHINVRSIGNEQNNVIQSWDNRSYNLGPQGGLQGGGGDINK